MNITHNLARQYIDAHPGFNADQGQVPNSQMMEDAMSALVAKSNEIPNDTDLVHLHEVLRQMLAWAPVSAKLFKEEIVNNPVHIAFAKRLEMGLAVLEAQSPETWEHVKCHTALTMMYYEKQLEQQNVHTKSISRDDPYYLNATQAERLTLLLGALGHDMGKVGLAPELLHKSKRINKTGIDAKSIRSLEVPIYSKTNSEPTNAVEMFVHTYKEMVPYYAQKEDDIRFVRAANQGDVSFSDIFKDVVATWQRIEKHSECMYAEERLTQAQQALLMQGSWGTLTPLERHVVNTHDAMSKAFMKAAINGDMLPEGVAEAGDIVSMDHFRDRTTYKSNATIKHKEHLAEIIHAMDVLHALTDKERSYRTPLAPREAIGQMQEEISKARPNAVDSKILVNIETNGTLAAYEKYIIKMAPSAGSFMRSSEAGQNPVSASPVVASPQL